MNEITITLSDPFEYAHKGDMRNAEFITLHAPSVENIGYVGKLKQGFMRAMMGQNDNVSEAEREGAKESKGIDDLDAETIMMMMSMSSEVEYHIYLQTAREALIAKSVALVDGEEPLTKSLINKISIEDFEKMVGEYLRVFIVASALKMMQT